MSKNLKLSFEDLTIIESPKPGWIFLRSHSLCTHEIQPSSKQTLIFTCLQYESLENTVGKGEFASNEQFLFFPQSFLHVLRPFFHFHQTLNCRMQTL